MIKLVFFLFVFLMENETKSPLLCGTRVAKFPRNTQIDVICKAIQSATPSPRNTIGARSTEIPIKNETWSAFPIRRFQNKPSYLILSNEC